MTAIIAATGKPTSSSDHAITASAVTTNEPSHRATTYAHTSTLEDNTQITDRPVYTERA